MSSLAESGIFFAPDRPLGGPEIPSIDMEQFRREVYKAFVPYVIPSPSRIQTGVSPLTRFDLWRSAYYDALAPVVGSDDSELDNWMYLLNLTHDMAAGTGTQDIGTRRFAQVTVNWVNAWLPGPGASDTEASRMLKRAALIMDGPDVAMGDGNMFSDVVVGIFNLSDAGVVNTMGESNWRQLLKGVDWSQYDPWTYWSVDFRKRITHARMARLSGRDGRMKHLVHTVVMRSFPDKDGNYGPHVDEREIVQRIGLNEADARLAMNILVELSLFIPDSVVFDPELVNYPNNR